MELLASVYSKLIANLRKALQDLLAARGHRASQEIKDLVIAGVIAENLGPAERTSKDLLAPEELRVRRVSVGKMSITNRPLHEVLCFVPSLWSARVSCWLQDVIDL